MCGGEDRCNSCCVGEEEEEQSVGAQLVVSIVKILIN